MRTAVIISIVSLVLAGCSRKVVEVPIYVHDTLRTVQVERDSVVVDRIREVTKSADTIYVRDSVAVLRVMWRHDTLRQSVEVPVTVTHTETVEVEKSLRWWQKALMWLGGLAGIATVWIVFRRLKNAF